MQLYQYKNAYASIAYFTSQNRNTSIMPLYYASFATLTKILGQILPWVTGLNWCNPIHWMWSHGRRNLAYCLSPLPPPWDVFFPLVLQSRNFLSHYIAWKECGGFPYPMHTWNVFLPVSQSLLPCSDFMPGMGLSFNCCYKSCDVNEAVDLRCHT